jgi:mannose-1-phosphate guanylyltransferase
MGRGTAVAIAYGAAVIARGIGEDASIAVMPADHHVVPAAGFRKTIGEAFALADRNDAIVVVGVTPTRAESGYGYQQIGRRAGVGFKVMRFVEKPAQAVAAKMVRSGKYLWNAGIFVMRLATLRTELAAHAPGLSASMTRLGTIKGVELEREYEQLKFDSFDRVIAEKSRNVIGVRARFRWHDVGSWEGLWEALGGRDGNVLSGNVIAIGADGVLARGGDRLMVLLGVSDLVAIDTGDVVLIARRSQSQEVRGVIDELRRRGLERYL